MSTKKFGKMRPDMVPGRGIREPNSKPGYGIATPPIGSAASGIRTMPDYKPMAQSGGKKPGLATTPPGYVTVNPYMRRLPARTT